MLIGGLRALVSISRLRRFSFSLKPEEVSVVITFFTHSKMLLTKKSLIFLKKKNYHRYHMIKCLIFLMG